MLWVMTDHLRYDALSYHHSPNVQTPRIDQLARDGVSCDRAFSHYPVCVPMRAGLVTGQYNHVNGVRVHGDLLPPDRQTIAHAFRDVGYRTSWVGKWHLAGVRNVSGWQSGEDYWVHPFLRGGFEDWFGFEVSNNYYHNHYSTGYFTDPVKLEGYQTDSLTDLSLTYLEETAIHLDQPWFHVLSLESPHPGVGLDGQYGYNAPPEFEARFNPDQLLIPENVPPEFAAKREYREALAKYYAMVANVDYNVGRILDWLENSGQADETLVVFFSDHGDMLCGQGWEGYKQVPYNESIQIPLIMRLPKSIPADQRYAGLVSGIDIFPTCAGLCGVPIPPQVQGVNHSGPLLGNEGVVRSEVLVQWLGQPRYPFGDHPYRAIRTARYTYSVCAPDVQERYPGHFCLLFDNQTDPHQMNNLFGKKEAADLQQKMHAHLCRAILASGETMPNFIEVAPHPH